MKLKVGITMAIAGSMALYACGKKSLKSRSAPSCVAEDTEDATGLRLADGDDAGESDTEDCVSLNGAEVIEPIGTITKQDKSTLKFSAQSAYATVSTAGEVKAFSLHIAESKVDELSLTRDVKKYECVECEGDDDPRCAEPEAPPKVMTVSFVADAISASKGLPAKSTYTLEGDDAKDAAVGISVSYTTESEPTAMKPTGTIKFKKKPKAVGSEFAVSLTLKMKVDGKTRAYNVDIESKVLKLGKQPKKIPTCEEGEYLKPVYVELEEEE